MAAANPLRLLWVNGITTSSGPRSATTEKFFGKQSITVNAAPKTGEVALYIGNPKKTIELFSHEADRFASACFESLLSEATTSEYPRSIGWLLIRGYYAAFFAMHALLRIHGWACTRMTKATIAPINQDLKIFYPHVRTLDAGLYFLRTGNGGAELICRKMDSSIGGGSHEILWSLLDVYMQEITDMLLVHSGDGDEFKDLASAIDRFLVLVKQKGGSNWFTQVRNRVNYSHEYGAWYPYIRSTCDAQRIKSVLDGWRVSPDDALLNLASDELIQFSAACSFIVSLCRTTVEDLVFRSKSNSPFRSSSGRLLELAKAPAR